MTKTALGIPAGTNFTVFSLGVESKFCAGGDMYVNLNLFSLSNE